MVAGVGRVSGEKPGCGGGQSRDGKPQQAQPTGTSRVGCAGTGSFHQGPQGGGHSGRALEGVRSEGLEALGALADDGAGVAGDEDVFARGEGREVVGSGQENNIIDRIRAQRLTTRGVPGDASGQASSRGWRFRCRRLSTQTDIGVSSEERDQESSDLFTQ